MSVCMCDVCMCEEKRMLIMASILVMTPWTYPGPTLDLPCTHASSMPYAPTPVGVATYMHTSHMHTDPASVPYSAVFVRDSIEKRAELSSHGHGIPSTSQLESVAIAIAALLPPPHTILLQVRARHRARHVHACIHAHMWPSPPSPAPPPHTTSSGSCR